ncbi:hypothetical protein [Klebsiella oxytoca]|uniref:hypothetical protein n=1 Tax=Klebsiella oxytoca TaxID=571 RepID=UPI001B31E1F3|nr:hypothetical protein [Klebsiella oxytoca]
MKNGGEKITAPQAPVTDEELDQMIWKLERDGGMTPKLLSLMKELREVRKAKGEPVAYTDERNLGYIDRGRETAYLWGKQNSETGDVPLYRHAQQPIVGYVPLGDSPYDVPCSMPSNLREFIDQEIGILFSDDDAQGVWIACRRAAMLQAGSSLVIGIDPASGPDRTVEVRYVAPPGYVMVPKEPTPEMLAVINEAIKSMRGSAATYARVLAASPQELK